MLEIYKFSLYFLSLDGVDMSPGSPAESEYRFLFRFIFKGSVRSCEQDSERKN